MNLRPVLLSLPVLLLAPLFSQACTISSTANNPDAGITNNPDASTPNNPDGGTCDLSNHTRETASPIMLGTAYSACLAENDKNFYSFTAPADAEGGYVVADITNVSVAGFVSGHFFTTSDNGEILNAQPANAGAALKLYVAVASGVTYTFLADHYAGGPAFTYDMKLTYTKNVDPSAGAKTKATAAQLVLGTASSGLFMAGYKAATIPDADYERYFKIDLSAGPATVKLENVASDVLSQFQVIDSANTIVATVTASNAGANPPSTPPVTIPAIGTYYIVPGLYAGGRLKAAGQGAVPDSFTHKYTVTVTQP